MLSRTLYTTFFQKDIWQNFVPDYLKKIVKATVSVSSYFLPIFRSYKTDELKKGLASKKTALMFHKQFLYTFQSYHATHCFCEVPWNFKIFISTIEILRFLSVL